MEGSTVQDRYLKVVEVIGSPLPLNKKLGVGVRAVPICGVHAVEVSKNVGSLVPVWSVAHGERDFIIRDEGFVFENGLGHHNIEIFDSWAEIHTGQFDAHVEDVEGQVEAWGYRVDGDLVGPFDLFPPDCAEGHASEDDGEEDDDSEWEDSSGEGFEIGILLVSDKLCGGEEIGVMDHSPEHFEKSHRSYFKIIGNRTLINLWVFIKKVINIVTEGKGFKNVVEYWIFIDKIGYQKR